MADAEQTFVTEIAADVADCVDVLLDFERYPDWSGPITSARILERDDEGRGRDV